MLELTRQATPDEILTKLGRYTGFWKEIFEESESYKASDIHVHPMKEGLRVRIRVAGVLRVLRREVERHVIDELIIILKQISDLDTGTRRIRQDDSFEIKMTDSAYRVALSPGGGYGEGLVFRIIREEDIPDIRNLGLSRKALADIKWASSKSQGFFLVTGPTGSGKSTTLQACLMEVDREALNVITIEDPVERHIPGVFHQKINPDFGWKDAIKHSLRADPDVILIGEMRDEESAQLAVEAAQTGHLVMSTLHTNSVVDTIDRLFLMGIKNYEVADSLLFVSSQRLELKLCMGCKIPDKDLYIRNHKGCSHCAMGYKGRVPLVEYILNPDPRYILEYNKEALKESLSQTMDGELLKAIERGDIDYRVLESAR
jgi:type II secretory ATPase GspE/PulE/Tfp pilus assembly ATPase PilB-like protein